MLQFEELEKIGYLNQVCTPTIPNPSNLKSLLVEIARYEFLIKPLGALHALHSGVAVHLEFWNSFSVKDLYSVYNSLKATPARILEIIKEPTFCNAAEERSYMYLVTYVGNLTCNEAANLLRFITGSSALVSQDIFVTFNKLSGLARRPIAHTCSCTLELPTSYSTYPEFSHEFTSILRSEFAWIMDAI